MLALMPFALAVAFAQDPVSVESTIVPVTAPINAVTLYQGSAAVTRSTALPHAAGVYELRFANLPATVQADSLQAKVAPPAKLLDVRYEEIVTPTADAANNPELSKVQKDLEAIRIQRRDVEAKNQLTQAQVRTLEAIVTKISQGAARDVGAPELDPAKLKAQLDFLASERERAMAQMVAIDETKRTLDEAEVALKARAASLGGGEKRARTGVVVVAIADPISTGAAELTYLVREATWRPNYALRAMGDLSGLDVEYEAVIRQHTGEDWKDVALTLSTAQPSRSANPPPLDPISVSKGYRGEPVVASAPPMERSGRAESDQNGLLPGKRKRTQLGGGLASPADRGDADAAEASRDAEIVQNSTVATFTLPRTASFPSDASREQKTRIATIPLKPEYVYVSRPAVDPEVYLRGKTRNDSAYQFLAGRATVFLGNDSVGAVQLPDVAPGAEVELWFGPDRRISAKRVLIARNQSESGLISKESVVALQYKIELTNSITKPVKLELWDRIPVSQDSDITVKLSDVQPPLSKDAAYEGKERKQGLLKWLVELPPRPADRAAETIAVRWNVSVSWPKDTPVTWFPE